MLSNAPLRKILSRIMVFRALSNRHEVKLVHFPDFLEKRFAASLQIFSSGQNQKWRKNLSFTKKVILSYSRSMPEKILKKEGKPMVSPFPLRVMVYHSWTLEAPSKVLKVKEYF